jgi:cell wall-associated NlpC family hydrolase
MASEADERKAVIAEARSWLHTPWRHACNIKGEAVDCAMFLLESFVRPGIFPRFDPRPYPRDWFMHHSEERFIGWILKFGGVEIPVNKAQPGDVIMYKLGRCYAHGAVLVAPKLVIHSYARNKQVILTETFDPTLATRSPRAFDMWAARRAHG